MLAFIDAVVQGVESNADEGSVFDCFKGVLDIARAKLSEAQLGHREAITYSQIVQLFTRTVPLSKVRCDARFIGTL